MTTPEKDPKDPENHELSRIEESKSGALSLPATAEQMQQVADRLADVQSMLKSLPGTIGAAVADALLKGRPANASGAPPVPMAQGTGDLEFGKGQAIKRDGDIVFKGVPLPAPKAPPSKKLGTRPAKA